MRCLRRRVPDASRFRASSLRAALLSSGLPWPMRRVTVNLAPSGVRKAGAGLDLPIAIGLLVAAGDLPPDCTDNLAFCGELGLNGSLRHVPGMLALAACSSGHAKSALGHGQPDPAQANETDRLAADP